MPAADAAAPPLKRTPLYSLHQSLGARMVPFAGYEMPVHYPAGILAEHLHTRAAAGLFDVSHMGQLRLVGADPATALETLVPGDISGLGPMRMRYTLLLNGAGGILDDLMATRLGDGLFLVVNAATKDADCAHLRDHLGGVVTIERLDERALLALQGPCGGSGSVAAGGGHRGTAVHDCGRSCARRPSMPGHALRLHRRGRLRDFAAGGGRARRWPKDCSPNPR